MNKIDSFEIDHLKLKPGVYKRKSKGYNTFDIRVVEPYPLNSDQPRVMDVKGMHTMEHLLAHYFREKYGEEVIYVGGMMCLTGFYLVSFPTLLTEEKVKKSLLEYCEKILRIVSLIEVPGVSKKECGNYKFHDIFTAKMIASKIINSIRQ